MFKAKDFKSSKTHKLAKEFENFLNDNKNIEIIDISFHHDINRFIPYVAYVTYKER